LVKSSDYITAFEYFDENNELLRDSNTYLGKSPLDMVHHFARVYGQTTGHEWVKDTNKDLLRLVLLKEEYAEVLAATKAEDLLKELADLVYVTYGYAATFNWNLDEAVRRVHASNMSKLDDEGDPIYREDGKVLKGPNYQEPDLTDLI
jgi:predicted HAD superfamily Cof-like phosphohydrolase